MNQGSKNVKNTKEKCFWKNISIYGIESTEDLKNWEYAGGDGISTRYNTKDNLILSSERKYSYQRGITSDMMKKIKKEYCPCGSKITNNMYIQHKTDKKKIIVVGNICIRKFMNKDRHCCECGSVHKNTRDNICNSCRKSKKAK